MRRLLVIGLTLALPACATAPASEVNKQQDATGSAQEQEQQSVVAAIRNWGGEVLYDYQRPNPNKPNVFNPKAVPKTSKGFHAVVRVNLRDTKVVDDDLMQLGKLPDLENLDLTNTQITSAGLAHLRGLKSLAVLSLWKTKVDDDGLKHLKDSIKLYQLVLDETKITDAGLAHLKDLTNLEEWLGLTDTKVTDKGLQHLQGLAKLRSLNLRRTKVTAEGVKDLQTALPITRISFGP